MWQEARGPVIKRRVFYLPGFDERAPEAYWGLYRRESRNTSARRGIAVEVGEAVRAAEGDALSWEVSSGGAQTTYTLLRWDDIVGAYFPRSTLARLLGVPTLMLRLLLNGYIGDFLRHGARFPAVILGVHAIFLVLAALSFGLAALAAGAIPGEMPLAIRVALGVALAFIFVVIAMRLTRGKPLYVPHLVDDTAFTHRHAAGRAPEMRERLARFGARIAAASRDDADEIVIVGHSSGSFLIIEVLDHALRTDPQFATRGPPVTLVTIGGVLPWIMLDPNAEGPRRALAAVAAAREIAWFDLAAWWDWLSIHGRGDPVSVSGLPPPPEGRIETIEIRLADLIDKATRRRTNFNLFQRHFQTLMASQPHAAFDYILMTAGAEPARAFLRRCMEGTPPRSAERRKVNAARPAAPPPP